MLFFDREALLAQGDLTPAKDTTLTGTSIAFILACTGILENRDYWGEMTDSEWDSVEILISALVEEII